jgi:signal transduction histidine kinase
MKCARCHQDNPAHARFCLECGTPFAPAHEAGHLHRALTAALEQQTATAEILRVIRSSPADVQPVFDTIVRSAVRLCDGLHGFVGRFDGELIHFAAQYNYTPEALQMMQGMYPRRPDRKQAAGRAILTGDVVNIADLQADPEYTTDLAVAGGWRSALVVPMLSEDKPIGTIGVIRGQAGRFSDAHVELLRTFADQAVIAVENVRLFTELETRTRELTQALDRQTATSEILRVISSSRTDLQPVFDTIVRNAVRLCGASHGGVYRLDGELVHSVAHDGYMPEQLRRWRATWPKPVTSANVSCRAIATRGPIRIRDYEATGELGSFDPETIANMRARGSRSVLAVPMFRQDEVIGAISLAHRDVDAFSDRHLELLETFAAQAVIAIENARLLKELEERTHELSRSVDQLTALGEVGRAVSSTLDLETVLTTIVSRAVQLSELDGGVVFEYDAVAEELVHRVATETGGTLAEARRATRVRKGEGVVGRTAITLEPAQLPDITVRGADQSRLRENLIASGIRAILAVPMLSEDRLVGCLVVSRNQPGEFPVETVDLLRTFATQSALAIQNARLFEEIADKGRQLEAASRHKSEFLANMSHELRTPLNAVIGFSEVLLQRMFGELNAKQDEYLKDIYASGQHLLSLINDILDLSKIEAGRMELTPAPFHLPSALENAVTLVKERAARHAIVLHVDVDPRLGEVVGDERKVKQVLLNLLSNAVKFTPEGGRISLKAAGGDGVVEIAVTDTGIGIAPEDQAAIFEEFRQVGSDEIRKQEGTGLGLTLARKFVELHGGRIWVQSDVGRGSTFTFTLPV